MKAINEIWAKIYGKLVSTENIEFDKDMLGTDENIIMRFDIYDGFAYCADFNGKEYGLSYPTLNFIKSCKIMLNSAKDFMGLHEEDDISVTDILQSYGSLFKIETYTIPQNEIFDLNTEKTMPHIVNKEDNATEPISDAKSTTKEPEYYEADVYRP